MKARILIAFLILVISGCATSEKKAKKYYLENKDQLAEICSTCFPVKEKYVKGEDVYLPSDTVFVKGDNVFIEKDCPDGTKIKVECPPNDTIKVYIPIMRIDTIVKADSAAIYYWKSEYGKIESAKKNVELDNAAIKKSRNGWMYWTIGLGLFIVIRFGFWAYKTFTLR